MEDLRELCQAWARGDFYPMSFEDREDQLDPQVAGREEAWWSAIVPLVDELGQDELSNLTEGPVVSLIRLRGELFMKRIEAAAAAGSDRWATVYCDLQEWYWEEEGRSWAGIVLQSLGEERTMRTYCSHGVDDWDTFWSWRVVQAVAEGEAPDISPWPFLLRLLDIAQTQDEIGSVAAGPLEDFVKANAETYFDAILAEEASNPKLREALRGIYWPTDKPVEIVERLQAASNEPRLEGGALSTKAEERVKREFERVVEVLDSALDAFNRVHPYTRYSTIEEAAMAAFAQAGAVQRFAEDLGLIDHYKSGPFVREFLAAHPEFSRVLRATFAAEKPDARP
jgi:hypothetical protein